MVCRTAPQVEGPVGVSQVVDCGVGEDLFGIDIAQVRHGDCFEDEAQSHDNTPAATNGIMYETPVITAL